MDAQVGVPVGPPAAEHWPGGKGYWQQPARVVDMTNEFRSEWAYLQRGPKPKKQAEPKPAPPKRASRRR